MMMIVMMTREMKMMAMMMTMMILSRVFSYANKLIKCFPPPPINENLLFICECLHIKPSRLAGRVAGNSWHSCCHGSMFCCDAKHGSYKSTAICDMQPSGPIKMQPLFKLHPVSIQLGSDQQRLGSSFAYFSS